MSYQTISVDDCGILNVKLQKYSIRPQKIVSRRAGLLFGCSLAALVVALGPVAATDDGLRPERSPSTLDATGHPLTAADFRAWDAYAGDWGLGTINAADAYARGFTGLNVPVAVVDGGIDPDHPKFAGRILSASRNFWFPEIVTRDGRLSTTIVTDVGGHGTHVSGTIGASPSGGEMMGVAYESRILSLNALMSTYDDPKKPNDPSDATKIERRYGFRPTGASTSLALGYAADQGARVVNGSFGTNFYQLAKSFTAQEYDYFDYLTDYQAVKYGTSHDVLFVFAAGNNRGASPVNIDNIAKDASSDSLTPYIRPGNANSGVYQFYDRNIGDPDKRLYDQSRVDFSDVSGYVIAVASLDKDNSISAYSNLCGVAAQWCISAPGSRIYSTWPLDLKPDQQKTVGYFTISGTSMAAPHVTGAAAVLRQAFPFLKAPEIAQTLFTTATHLGEGPADTPNDVYGWGLLNLGKAIDGPGQFTYTWTVDTTYNGQAYYGTFANDISGVGGLIKIGAGTLELSGDNTYTGGTHVYGGNLAVWRDANLGANDTGLTLGGGGRLRVLADGFSTARPVTLDGNGGLRIDGGTSTFAGVFADGTRAGSLTKTGPGTAILTAANTHTGGTEVAAGTLGLTATGRLVSPVSVAADAGFVNAGLASGGVTNAGTVNNSGTIAGGLTNTGTVIASAGWINGAIRNDAGLFTVSGSVASDGTLANAAGATLAVAGAYSLAGPLTNAGTVTVAQAASLTAPAGLGNAGSLTNGGLISGAVSNTGTVTTSGTITGGLANAGVAINGGVIAGGTSNSGPLATSGTLSGGLTNTGTVLASAGRIDGAIRNQAGTLAVTGAVASDGTVANAAGATLAVTGAYSLGGPLTNAGTVAVARTASLTAPAGFGNAGLLTSDGILTTDLTNTGTARLSGQLNGALVNTGALRFTGPLSGLTSLTNAGPLDLAGNALTLSSLSGTADAVLANGGITVTGSANSTYAGAILQSTAPTSLTKAGSGTLTLTGTGRFSGPTTVQAGTLSLNGIWTSPVTVAAAGTLRGIGTVAAPVTVAGALRPGNSPGTLTVLGPVAFASGSLFGLDIDGTGTGTGAGSYARLLALGPSGTVAANGTLQPVLRGITGNATNRFTPALGQRFGVLTAQAGLTGAFTGLAQPGAGLAAGTRFDALYRATGLDLVVTPAAYGDLAGLGLAQTGNARAVGAALDVARPAAGTRPDADRARVFDGLYAAAPATLPGGLASLSGQAYGDAVMADLAARRLVTDTIDRHLRGQGGGAAAFSAGDPGLGPNRSALQLRGAAGAPDQPLAAGEGRVWAEALYGFGSRAGDRAAAGADRDAGGLLLGVDRQVGSGLGADTLVGGAFSYLRETGTGNGQGSGSGFGPGRTTADSYGSTLYASTRLGPVILRGTAGASYADGRIDRTVALGSSVSRASGLASGWDAGVAGFAGYALGSGLPVELVPEVGFSYDRLTRGRVAERGGLASQRFATADLNAARVLAGGRLASLALDDAAGLRLEGRAYWAHELGDTSATVRSSLFGVPFASRTSALGRDGAVLGVSLTGPVAEGVLLSLSYTGDVRPGANAQVVSAGLQARW